jgi:hypothetical protein
MRILQQYLKIGRWVIFVVFVMKTAYSKIRSCHNILYQYTTLLR